MLDVERCRSEGDLSIGIEEVMGDNSKRKPSIIERGDVSDTISKRKKKEKRTTDYPKPTDFSFPISIDQSHGRQRRTPTDIVNEIQSCARARVTFKSNYRKESSRKG